MPSPNAPGLSGLALVARDPRPDLRPALLRVHTDLFVTATVRDRAAIETFESLATGLLPTVDDATVAIVARKLASCPDAPPSILAALRRRAEAGGEAVTTPSTPPSLGTAVAAGNAVLARTLAWRSDLTAATLERLVALDDSTIDLALAGNRRLVLTPTAVRHLVRKARLRPALAEEMLPRPELTVFDRAALYLHAGAERRARIRAEVAGAPALAFRRPAVPTDGGERTALLVAARRGEGQAFERRLEGLIGCDPQDWRFDDPFRHDLLGLALLAAGIDGDDAIRVALLLPESLAQSVAAVFRFAALVRGTSRAAAGLILEASLGVSPGERRSVNRPVRDRSEVPAQEGPTDPAAERQPSADRSRRHG
jgi:hypothetical protein